MFIPTHQSQSGIIKAPNCSHPSADHLRQRRGSIHSQSALHKPPRQELVLRETIDPKDIIYLPGKLPVPLNIEGIVVLGKRIELDHLQDLLGRRLLPLQRFFQRPVEHADDRGRTTLYWADDPNFAIERHTKSITLPGGENWQSQLKATAEMIVNRPLPEDAPLWDTWLVQIGDNRSALIFRVNHAVSDGVGLVSVLLGVTDNGDSVDIPGVRTMAKEPGETSKEGSSKPQVNHSPSLTHALEYGKDWVSGLWKMLSRGREPLGPLKSASSVESIRVGWQSESIPLDEVKKIGKACGSTINDVVLSIVAGALRRYAKDHGEVKESLAYRAMLPVNIKPMEKRASHEGKQRLGNHLASMVIDLPASKSDPVERLEFTKTLTRQAKRSPELVVNAALLGLVGRLGQQSRDFLTRYVVTDKVSLILSNVPGPAEKLTMDGIEVDDLKWIIPLFNNLGLSVQVMSYNGSIRITMSHDQNHIKDHEAIPAYIRDEFFALKERTLGVDGVPV